MIWTCLIASGRLPLLHIPSVAPILLFTMSTSNSPSDALESRPGRIAYVVLISALFLSNGCQLWDIHGKGYDGILGMEHGRSRPGPEGEEAVIAAYVAADDF